MKALSRIVGASFLVATLLAPFAHSQTPPTADSAAGSPDKLVYLGAQDMVSTWLLTAQTAVMHLADGSEQDVKARTLGMSVVGFVKVRFDKAIPSADRKTWTYSGNVTVEWEGGRLASDEVVLQKLGPR